VQANGLEPLMTTLEA